MHYDGCWVRTFETRNMFAGIRRSRGFIISVLSIASRPSTGKCAHTRQVVADLRQHEELVYAFKSSIHRLSNSSDCLASSEHLLNALTFLLADCATRPTRSSLVNC